MARARDNSEHMRPAQIVARRVREARTSRGWTQKELAEEKLAEVGYPKTRETLTKLESGRNRDVSIDDVFALAAALGVSPVHLLTPLEDEVTVEITRTVRYPAKLVRAWIRGQVQLPMLPDVDLRQIPKSELLVAVRGWVRQELARDEKPHVRRLMAYRLDEQADAIARDIVEEMLNPKEEDDG